ncbi:6563_t:CDS:1, partial [Rhizophagus irregularis]
MGSSDNFFSDIISLAINWNNYLDPNVDEDELIEDGLRMDEFMGTMYAAFGLLP